jgi:hypothetical protein
MAVVIAILMKHDSKLEFAESARAQPAPRTAFEPVVRKAGQPIAWSFDPPNLNGAPTLQPQPAHLTACVTARRRGYPAGWPELFGNDVRLQHPQQETRRGFRQPFREAFPGVFPLAGRLRRCIHDRRSRELNRLRARHSGGGGRRTGRRGVVAARVHRRAS